MAPERSCSFKSTGSIASKPEQQASPTSLPLHAPDSPNSNIFNGSVSLKNQMLAQGAQAPVSSGLSPTQPGQPGRNQVDPSVLQRMIAAQGKGVHSMPIRVASMQDFRRSVNSLNTVPESFRQPRLRAPNQSFKLENQNGAMNEPGRPMMSDNPLLKMMEQRMAAKNISSTQRQQMLPTITASPSPPLPEMSGNDKGALQASIKKWAYLGNSASTEKAVPKESAVPIGQSKVASPGSPSGRVPLSHTQIELLKELTEQRDVSKEEQPSQKDLLEHMLLPQARTLNEANGTGRSLMSNNLQQAQQLGTRGAGVGLTRCAMSVAEVDRLRRENQSIQLLQEMAMQERAYLHQRNIAASALLSMQPNVAGQVLTQEQTNQTNANSLRRTETLNSLAGSAKSSSSFRKRPSVRDEDESTCSIGSSYTNNNSIPSVCSSHKIHRSLSQSSARAALSGSLENLRIKSPHVSMLGLSNRNESFSSGLNVTNQSYSHGLNVKNQSFSSGSRLSRKHSSQASLKRNSSSNNWIKSLLSEQKSAGNAAAAFEVVKRSNNSLVTLVQNQPSPAPQSKALEEIALTVPVKVQAEEYAPPSIERPRSASCEKVIISAVPDRLKYKDANPEKKPIDVVKEALSSRGAKCNTKPSMEMGEDFFVKVTEMYDQEIVNAIRTNDVASLKELSSKGTNLQCGNRFGETLIHLACRRSSKELVSFLVNEEGLSLHVRDDFGRTPLHDACWRTEPDLEILDLLLDKAPELLMLSDKRGHTPLDYSRREHW
eukprot:CAMPEP_0183702836 /NCGR_PEP_ID=MMETSP0737-20130205/807_1 /TAXON_ID=385413 /ORGANISM="Thalassiosira miniscula, Strain CCMP1093" /LENGTH=769 /DNA_ID=CAMNT_0025929513 /DNA_START=219 /DNA_END=2525 /DNA_ORIENTATION=-